MNHKTSFPDTENVKFLKPTAKPLLRIPLQIQKLQNQ